VTKPIFTISGLRGIWGENLHPQLVADYSSCFGKFVNGENIAIGRDTRTSGMEMFLAVVKGLFNLQYNVYDFGICPTPAIMMMVKKFKLDGGIQITASHNPEEWNGLKFISRQGRFLYPQEVEKFKQQLNIKSDNIQTKKFPNFEQKEIIELYLKNIVNADYFKKIQYKKFKIGIDSCNGAAEESAMRLVKMLDSIPISIKKPSDGFPRGPEPKAENLKRLCLIIRKEKLDFGIAFDPDGDRFACVDETGTPLSEEMSVLLATQFILEQQKGPVVVNNSTTMAIDKICQQFNVPIYRSKTGEINVVKMMKEVNAIVGGEGNGGVIVPKINTTRDGLVATAILISLLSKKNSKLSQIRKELPQFFMDKTEINKYKDNWIDIITKLFRNDKDIKIDRQEGLKIFSPNFWILLRKSNTEPILRIIAESDNKSLTNRLIADIIKEIKVQ
jgi:phosphomannomutase